MIALGIDPGVSGAIAALRPDGSPRVIDMPTIEVDHGGTMVRRIHGRRLLDAVMHLVDGRPVGLCVLERMQSFGHSPASPTTEFGLAESYGAVRATLEILGMTPELVLPKAWQRDLGIEIDPRLTGKDRDKARKAESRRLAQALVPALEHELARVKDHNRAEAVLLAWWGQRQLRDRQRSRVAA